MNSNDEKSTDISKEQTTDNLDGATKGKSNSITNRVTEMRLRGGGEADDGDLYFETSDDEEEEEEEEETRMNNAGAGSPGSDNDPKQALDPQVAVRGLNKIIGTRATTILNSTNNINKATSIPNKLITNSMDKNIINDNNNNISGVTNVI
jgi:hypothetical protein